METIFQGKSGTIYTITEPALGSGGEGIVYGLQKMPNHVAKVYKDGKRNVGKERKLLAMIAAPLPTTAMNQVTWPTDVIYQNGQFMGFIMMRINIGEDLNVMYDQNGKYKSLKQRIAIAKNLCAAINAVHGAKQVCGDLNPKNISVNPKNVLITLVDTDSYHITDQSNKTYRCEVGLPAYLPREIQEKMKNGNNLINAALPTYTRETDRFALAVHIFQLLMNGCHPFATAVIIRGQSVSSIPQTSSQPSVTNPQPEENIIKGNSPFFRNMTGLSIPLYAPPVTALPREIQNLFEKAFVAGHSNSSARPTPIEWHKALERMEQNIKTCRTNNTHEYAEHLTRCPWCDVEKKLISATNPVTPVPSPIVQKPVYIPPSQPQQPYAPSSPQPRQPYTPTYVPQQSTKPKKKGGGWTVAAIVVVVVAIILLVYNALQKGSADTAYNINSSNFLTSSGTGLDSESSSDPLRIHTYEVVKADISWENAKNEAESKGGYLACIDSEEEFKVVTDKALEQEMRVIWVGAKRNGESDWNDVKWITGEPVAFFDKWYKNPNTGISEPSYVNENGVQENNLMILRASQQWDYNDANDADTIDAYGGKGWIGYVIEYEE